MKNIPTAKELIETDYFHLHLDTDSICLGSIETAMIEFAKLHVEAALKACIEDAPSGSSTDTVSYEDVVEALKDSYPLDKIK